VGCCANDDDDDDDDVLNKHIGMTNIKRQEFTQISLLHVSVFDHNQGACTEPG
jgi:hypothetical protein